MFIEIDKINIKDEKLEEIAVTSIPSKPNKPNIIKTAYDEVNRQIKTHLSCLKIINKTSVIIIIIKLLNILAN